jgi:glucose-6-phosphate dehydrogenase assembly protein OpcA
MLRIVLPISTIHPKPIIHMLMNVVRVRKIMKINVNMEVMGIVVCFALIMMKTSPGSRKHALTQITTLLIPL